jgi:hypothetical protein
MDQVRFLDTWSELNSWDLGGVQPLDFAQTLDKKFVFVLGQDGGIHVYSSVGEQLGTIRTGGAQPISFAIEARGRMLHLIDRSGLCTAVSVSLIGGSVDWSVLKKWKTAARPIDIAAAHERQRVFILEADNAVHVYSFAGRPLGRIAAPFGTFFIKTVPYSRKLYLAGRNGIFTGMEIPF